MSVRTMARVWADSKQSGTDLLMLLAIADFADDDGNAYPSVGTLAKKCRMTGRNANHILAALRASGELEVRANEGPSGTNRYRIVFQLPEEVKPASPLKSASPLKPTSSTPEAGFPKPLKPTSDKPSLNHQEPPKKARKRAAMTQVVPDTMLPEWLPPDAWRAFVEMRVSIRRPMTANAQLLMIRKLDRLREEGEDIRAVLEQSVIGSWTTVYRVKSEARSSSGVMDATEQFRGAI